MVTRRRKKTNEQIVLEFLNDAGYPTPASRFWERSSSPSARMHAIDVCRYRDCEDKEDDAWGASTCASDQGVVSTPPEMWDGH